LELQARLFEAGVGRAVGVSDLQIAATAIRHTSERTQVTVIHYDADFDHLVRVEPRLSARWIVPAGSVS
jgi:predicted nucleic acid-binding protein